MPVWERIKSVNGDLSAHLSDLIVFLGYLSVGVYAGGYQYISSYNEFFALPVKPDAGSLSTFVTYLESVLINEKLYITILHVAALIVLVIINFTSRNLFRVWFSYLTICSIAIISIIAFVTLGSYFGKKHAEHDISLDSNLPIINISILDKPECQNVNQTGSNSRLLFRDSAFIYYFEPVDPNHGEVIIDSVSSSCVAGVQLTRREA